MSGSTWRERERHGRPAFEVAPEEAIRRHADVERPPCAASSTTAGAVLLREREDAEDAAARRARRRGAWMWRADGADVRAGVARARRAARASTAACAPADRRRAMRCQPRGRTQMLAQQLPGLRIEQADVQVVPLHLDALPDPAGRRAVVRGLDFDAAIEMHGARRRSGSSETARAAAGRSAGRSSANIAATWRFVVPWMRVSAQCVSQRSRYACASSSVSKRRPLQRRLLRVADAGFDLALAIGIARRDTAARRRRSARARRDRAD